MEEMNIQNNENVIHEHTEMQPAESEQPLQTQQDHTHNDRERNLIALREAKERAEYERDQAIHYIRNMQMQSNNQSTPEDDSDPAPDDLPEWRHVDRKIKKLENQIKQYENYTQTNLAEARLKSQYSDFDKVVTPENIDILRNNYPEIAQSLHATPDLYNKAVATYNIMKKFGISKDYNPQSEYEKSLVQRNHSKPKATNAISPQQGETPLNRANEFANGFLTPERKAQLYKEMMDARNNY